jgi:hypothetical protein
MSPLAFQVRARPPALEKVVFQDFAEGERQSGARLFSSPASISVSLG